MTPGRKFSTITSVVANQPADGVDRRLHFEGRARLRLPALSWPKWALWPSRSGARTRMSSPSGGSILMTSAIVGEQARAQ